MLPRMTHSLFRIPRRTRAPQPNFRILLGTEWPPRPLRVTQFLARNSLTRGFAWSGRRESNPHHQLGSGPELIRRAAPSPAETCAEQAICRMCRRSDYPVLSAVSGWCRLFQARPRHGPRRRPCSCSTTAWTGRVLLGLRRGRLRVRRHPPRAVAAGRVRRRRLGRRRRR